MHQTKILCITSEFAGSVFEDLNTSDKCIIRNTIQVTSLFTSHASKRKESFRNFLNKNKYYKAQPPTPQNTVRLFQLKYLTNVYKKIKSHSRTFLSPNQDLYLMTTYLTPNLSFLYLIINS